MMRIKGLIIVLLFFHSVLLFAQQLGNEWIDYDLQYYKIKTGQDEFHRIGYEALLNAVQQVDPNSDLAAFNPNDFRLYHRGQEVAIRLVGLDDGSFDTADYIEFYGRRNDGTQDTELFYRAQDQIHQYYNLFSDTTAFFLQLEDGGNGASQPLRVQTLDLDDSGLPVVSVHKEEILNVYTNKFSFGQYYPVGNIAGEVKRSLYDRGQMFMSSEILKNDYGVSNELNFRDFLIEGISLQDESFGKPELAVQIVGFNNTLHNSSVFVGPSTNALTLLRDEIQLSYNNFGEFQQQIEWSNIESGRTVVRVEEVGFPDVPDSRIAVGFTRLSYPQFIDAQSQSKRIQLYGSSNDVVVSISNVSGEVSLFDLTDYRNPVLIAHQQNGSSLTAAVSNDSNGHQLYLRKNDEFVEAQLAPVTFKNDDLSGANYFIISHPYLSQAVDASEDPVAAYVTYRESVEGGNYQVAYADAPALYDEFSYGEYTPLAIRRFMRKAYNEGDPKYLFIIGKSSRVDIQLQRQANPLNNSRRELVPTMGAPGSDIVFVTGLNGQEHEPAFPVGRLSVTEPQQVVNYLNKVKEKEADITNSPWTKNFIQLSGGLTTEELIRYSRVIDQLASTVSSDFLGASVTNISKETNNAVQSFNISEQINRGAGFVTFFGHSSANFTDIDIGLVTDPSNGYNNAGRYPAFLVNGCRGGEIFYYSSFGENWLAAADKGAVNFISHSDVGVPTYLEEYTDHFYDVLVDTLWMTKSIGEIQKEVIKRQLQGSASNVIDFTLVEQNVLQGDPAIPLFGHDKVDYAIRSEDFFRESIDGRPINATTPFFNLGIIVNNGGRTTTDSVSINVIRTLSDETQIELPELKIPPVRFRDTVYYQVSNQGLDVFGENTFRVILDIENEIDEGNKLNNTATYSFFLTSAGTFNTAPAPFATIDSTRVKLVVQSADLKFNDKNYRVEIDTSAQFNSPWRQVNLLSGKGIGEWELDLLPASTADTVQYYWRSVFEEDLSASPIPWTNSSFTYINNTPEGFGQTEFDQFQELTLSSVAKDPLIDEWVFAGTQTNIEITTFGNQHPNGGNPSAMTVEIDERSMFASGSNRTCAPGSINAIAFDKDNGRPYLILRTPGQDFDILDPLNCGVTPQVINRITDEHLRDVNVTPDNDLLKQYIDGMDNGDYGLFFSNGALNYPVWRANAFEELGRVGASVSGLQQLRSEEPLILFGRKGEPQGSAEQIIGEPVSGGDDAADTEISFQTTIFASTDSGTVFSPLIGPVSAWGQLTKDIALVEGEDEITFEVRGRQFDGTEVVLFDNVTADQFDLSSIDADTYPYIRLYINMVDRVSATPAQLNQWLVSYQGVPEGVISLQNDQNEDINLEEGEPFEAQFRFSNISPYGFNGPLNVRYTFSNQSSNRERTETIQIPAIASGESTDFTLPIETIGDLGLNDLEVFVNPGDEIEQYYSNNRILLEGFYNVQEDVVNPAMDVTFDGIYIMDGDVVNAKPLIEIELKDNNRFKFKTDTTGVEIFLGEAVDGAPQNQVFFSDPNLTFIPATEEQNFKVQYTPPELGDGLYTLRARATDASGNLAGDDYVINFEVVNESTISNFYPYPNPFSTSVRFVFTLTGSEVPDNLKIQIFTVSGRLVREITKEEIGPIRIGNNITEYAWDGRDEFGDQLANGTYLYRVQIAHAGVAGFNRRATAGDKGFNNGFGKIVILR